MLKLPMYQKQSRQSHSVDGCDKFNDILAEMIHAWTHKMIVPNWTSCLTHNSHLFQSALLSAQSAFTEEEEEEKHAGHLRFP